VSESDWKMDVENEASTNHKIRRIHEPTSTLHSEEPENDYCGTQTNVLTRSMRGLFFRSNKLLRPDADVSKGMCIPEA